MAYLNGNKIAFGANLVLADGYTEEEMQEKYNEGFEEGKADGLKDLEQEKMNSWNEGMQQGYNFGFSDGHDSAVRTGTVTFTEPGASKILSISDLPSKPKELHLIGLVATGPTDDNQYFVGSLNYFRDGFKYSGGSVAMQAAFWLRTNLNVSPKGGANGSITVSSAEKNVVFSFSTGTFTIDLSYHSNYCFGEYYTYQWLAIF